MRINVELDDINKAFNEFDKSKLSLELDNYIKREYRYITVNNRVYINIKCDCSLEEQEKLIDVIHSCYNRKSSYYVKIDKYDNLFRIVFILAGALMIVLSSFFDSFIAEILSIVGWVPIWEATYDFFFGMTRREMKRRIYRKLSRCKIVFNEEDL